MSEHPKWHGWNRNELQIHFIHTGVAESIFFILPDGTTILNDCGDYPALTRWEYAVPVVPGPHRLAGDWIARYIQRVMPSDIATRNNHPLIDYMLLSHYHSDHCGTVEWQTIKDDGERLPNCYRSGYALAAEQLAFDMAIDRDWQDPNERVSGVQAICKDHMQRIYAALRERDGLRNEKFRLGADNQIVPRHAPESVRDFRILNTIANGRILRQDGSILDVYEAEEKSGRSLNENALSLGFRLTYGKFSFFTGGDFDAGHVLGPDGNTFNIEDALATQVIPADVAKINHHGFRNMTDSLVAALAARVWVVNISNTREVSEDCLMRISNRANYPGPRTIFPCVFADCRVAQAQGKDYLKDIAPETFGKGCHVVFSVPEGGETYKVTCIDASDEEMRIKGEYHFTSMGR